MKISTKGIIMLKEHEGFSATMYLDTANKPTIGYGTLIDSPDEQKYMTQSITKAKAEAFLRRDVAKAESAVNRYVTKKITQSQFDALVSFTYNLGSGNLRSSTLLKKINAGTKGEEIAKEFKKWVYSGGVRTSGLVTRRAKEAAMFMAGSKKKSSSQVGSSSQLLS